MGWNCFRTEDKENPTGPRTIGETLRQKFPRLYNMIQRVKEKGAPSRIKKRFRRRHRITPENPQAILQKQSGANITCTKVTEDAAKIHLTNAQSPNNSSCDIIPPEVIGTSPREDVHEEIERTTSPNDEQLELMADCIVSEVLKRAVQHETPPSTSESPSSNECLDEMVDDLVENTLSRAVSSTSFDSPHRVILVKEFYDGDQENKPRDNDQNVDGGKGDVAGPDGEIAIDKDPRRDNLSPERETRNALDKKPGLYDGSDSPVKRVLGQDDLLKLGLDISRRNTRLPTQYSFHKF